MTRRLAFAAESMGEAQRIAEERGYPCVAWNPKTKLALPVTVEEAEALEAAGAHDVEEEN